VSSVLIFKGVYKKRASDSRIWSNRLGPDEGSWTTAMPRAPVHCDPTAAPEGELRRNPPEL